MKLYAQSARLPQGWARNVAVSIAGDGSIADVQTGLARPPADTEFASGPLIPGMPNLHSHAFQRAFAGFLERRGPGEDSFWTWRRVMYDFVARVTPEQAADIAAWLYVEMLKSGYTAVGEFHYLHHGPDGTPYADPAEMSERVIAAARATGIAITHLPVLYRYGGFGGQPPGGAQLRFVNDAQAFARLLETLFSRHRDTPGVRIGIAPHSLRAVTPALLGEALDALDAHDAQAPVHIHVAEQRKEVDDCLAWSGARPVAWLLDNAPVNTRWCLVHATHMDDAETHALADSGAVAGLCPTTEGNLGDGIFPAAAYLAGGGRMGIGSDSHVSVSPVEELRLLEYGQRLVHHRRALLATPENPSVGASLYTACAAGGAQALGLRAGAIAPGRRADLVVLDSRVPALQSKPDDLLLDAMVFAGNVNPVHDVMVGGRWCVREGHHPQERDAYARFRAVLAEVRA